MEPNIKAEQDAKHVKFRVIYKGKTVHRLRVATWGIAQDSAVRVADKLKDAVELRAQELRTEGGEQSFTVIPSDWEVIK